MREPLGLASALLALIGLAAANAPSGRARLGQQDPIDTRRAAAVQAFVVQCASCHGESGDGKGTAQLDRQARSFKDGGFSYGNTPPALYRSITTGIPGTPMPGFEVALTEDQRRALAEYVLSLGPPDTIGDAPDKVLAVGKRSQVVRGLLPPIIEGASERPRGLLIGLPAGTSFEYRVDDVRLLGVRQGDFVERKDWVGRGGDALLPLGKLVHVYGKGDPRATFALLTPRAEGEPPAPPSGREHDLRARLVHTLALGERPSVSMRVVDEQGEQYAMVEEELSTQVTSVGSGWARRFRYTGGPTSGRIIHRFADDVDPEARETVFSAPSAGPGSPGPTVSWIVTRRAEGGFEARGVIVPNQPSIVKTQSPSAVWLELTRGRTAEVEVITLLVPTWSDEIQARMLVEVASR